MDRAPLGLQHSAFSELGGWLPDLRGPARIADPGVCVPAVLQRVDCHLVALGGAGRLDKQASPTWERFSR